MLNIYRASAGAGKTFALTLEYFKVIFANPYEYKNILAVTFTNKATEEMKGRILKELNRLACGESGAYGELLSSYLNFNKQQLQERAQLLQSLLLHDFGKIAITTIDAFFQRVVKSFARELGIIGGYNIELDSNLVLEKAIDRMLERVKKDSALKSWINELIASSIEEGSTWNVRKKIASLGWELFNESYKLLDEKLLEKLGNKEFLAVYYSFIDSVITHHETYLSQLGKEVTRILTDHSLSADDFSYKMGGPIGYFYKLIAGNFDSPGVRVRQAAGNDKGWYTAKSPRRTDIEAILPRINELSCKAIEFADQDSERYASALAVKKNIYLLGILNDLYIEVRDYCHENGVMLLSDTTQILNRLIEENETSFIFEKFGNTFKHIMIDEFQDTSTMQWRNFKPLLENSVAQDATTLLVGDVKQSIYRWRNSDWMLLAHQVEEEFKHLGTHNIFLTNNWRSSHEVVSFNNLFFVQSARLIANRYRDECPDARQWSEAIAGVYADVEQIAQQKAKGYVDIHFSQIENNEEITTYMMDEIIAIIKDIQQRGGEQKDIAILVRKGDEGAAIADRLMQYNTENPEFPIHFISNDSLYIWSSLYIKFIVGALIYLVRPDDQINAAAIAYYYERYVQKNNAIDADTLFKESVNERQSPLFQLLNERFKECNSLSLCEMIDQLIEHFHLNINQQEVPYLIAFQDVIYNYERIYPNNLTQFLEWWENEKGKQVLSTSEQVNAVRILTIHKSKGLEYDFVIVPYCNWKMDPTNPPRRIWCSNEAEGFDALECLPLAYSSSLVNSFFKDSYYEEHLKAYVDNLNLLYVALTRAKYELYLRPLLPITNKEGKQYSVSSLIADTIQAMNATSNALLKDLIIDDDLNLTYGIKRTYGHKTKLTTQTLFLNRYPVADSENRISIRFRFKDYTDLDQKEKIALDEGKVLHMLFKSIQYKEDITNAVRQGVVQGLIAFDEQTNFCDKMLDYITQEGVEEWFTNRYRIINERDIIFPSGARMRPDRVMINAQKEVIVLDYKFGKRQSKHYIKQVTDYCKTLRQLGYTNVKGIIWYPKLKKQVIV